MDLCLASLPHYLSHIRRPAVSSWAERKFNFISLSDDRADQPSKYYLFVVVGHSRARRVEQISIDLPYQSLVYLIPPAKFISCTKPSGQPRYDIGVLQHMLCPARP